LHDGLRLQLITKNNSLCKIKDAYRTRVARRGSLIRTGPSLRVHDTGIVVIFQAEKKRPLISPDAHTGSGACPVT
jgi:hypothetical protein